MRDGAGRGDPDDDLLAGAVEALAVLLDAGISPVTVWAYLAEDVGHPVMRRAAELVADGVAPSDALVTAAGPRAAMSARAGPAPRGRGLTWPGVGRIGRGAFDAGRVRTGDFGPGRSGRRRDGSGRVGRGGVDHGALTVASTWSVAEHAGAALSPALRGAATALRDRAETARDVRTSLAGPRATARLMAWLPAVGVAMAYLIGVDVVGALVAGPLGWAVAAIGVSFLAAGRAWTGRLVREASRVGAVAGTEHELMAIALAGGMSATHARKVIDDVRSRTGLDGGRDAGRSVERVLRIADRAGAPAVELLSAEARQERRSARAHGRARAEVLAVRLLLPLGICMLPAFVLLGVVPVILAMMSSTFTGLT